MHRLKLKRLSWRLLIVLLLLVCGLFTWRFIQSERQLNKHQADLTGYEQTIAITEEAASTMRAKLANVSDPNTVDAATRAAYNFIMPGELRFEIENSELLDNYTKEEWQILMDAKKQKQY